MQDRWSETDAQRAIERWGHAGEAVALRVYTSRLIGQDPQLVLHGGGNTSVKATARNLLGEDVPALYVKGSGWDLGGIEPEGFPAVDLTWLQRLRDLESMTDEEMVNTQRTHLFDASSPNPSVETLLHAFLPHTFIDHSHADAILMLTNHDAGELHARRALGDEVAIVPYVMPGFALAKLAAEVYEAHPDCIGLCLLKHGLFTFGATAQQSYQRHIELVSRAEAYLQMEASKTTFVPRDPPPTVKRASSRAARLAPLLRGALAEPVDGGWRRWVLSHRASERILAALDREELHAWSSSGPLTPDHVIRTKPFPLLLQLDSEDDAATHREAIEDAVRGYREAYQAYFDRNRGDRDLVRLDTTPRVVWIPGVGIIAIGPDRVAADKAADIAEHTLMAKEASGALGPWVGLEEHHLFDMEYWSLEQAKLGKKTEPDLARRVALVTGAAGAIGRGVARQLLAIGAHVVLSDIDPDGLERARVALGGGPRLSTVVMDLTEPDDVHRGFRSAALAFGGIDIVVANAGIAISSPIEQLDADAFRRVVDVNLNGAFHTVRAAARILKTQGTGGHIVIISSKNVLSPGAEFAAYSASKAGAHQLGKVAAMELAPHQIRVNMVAPDAVFADGEVQSGLWRQIGPDRARAKGLAPEDLEDHYRDRNLLKARITPDDVGRAVTFFVTEQTPTTGATLPVDGGVVSAFPKVAMPATAFILAAGFGTRLRPLTNAVPKPLVPVCGVPMLAYALAQCRTHGLTEVIVNAHWLADQVAAWEGGREGVQVTVSVEAPDILGTGGGLKAVRDRLADQVVVLNGDVLNTVDLGALLDAVPEGGGALALRPHPDIEHYGIVAADPTGAIVEMKDIASATPEGDPIRDTHFTGVHALDRAMLDLVPDGFACIIRTAYKARVPERRVQSIRHQGTWLDVGNPTAYLDANLAALDQTLALPLDPIERADTFDADARVWRGRGAHVAGSVRRSIVGSGAVVPEDASLVDCVVWDDVEVPAGHWERTIFWGGPPLDA